MILMPSPSLLNFPLLPPPPMMWTSAVMSKIYNVVAFKFFYASFVNFKLFISEFYVLLPPISLYFITLPPLPPPSFAVG